MISPKNSQKGIISLFVFFVLVCAGSFNLFGKHLDNQPLSITITSNPTPFASQISLIKSGIPRDNSGTPDGCDLIEYTFTVENQSTAGEVLTNVVVTDAMLGGVIGAPDAGDDNFNGELEPNEIWVYVRTYIIQQADLMAGEVVNQANVTANVQGQPGITVQDLSDDDSPLEDEETIVLLDHCQSISLLKSGLVIDFNGDGCRDSIRYTFEVTNDGLVDLNTIVLEDIPLFGGTIDGPLEGTDIGDDGILSIGETWTYEAIYDLTQTDIDLGMVTNQATVTGQVVNGDNEVIDLSDFIDPLQDRETIIRIPNDACADAPNIGLIKQGVVIDVDEDGCDESILYTFTVTNTGDMALHEVVVEDNELLGLLDIPGPTEDSDVGNDLILSVGETWTYQALYAITQADIDMGVVINQASVDALTAETNVLVEDDSHDTDLFADGLTRTPVPNDACTDGSPSLGLVKTGELMDVNGDECVESILYRFELTNTGDIALDEINLEDELLGGEVPGPTEGSDVGEDGVLSLGETWTYEALYAITQFDIDQGVVVNQATAFGQTVNSDIDVFDLSHFEDLFLNAPTRTIVPDDACTDGGADMGLTKDGELVDMNGDGCLDGILYTFELVNNGAADISGIQLEDDLLNGEVAGPLNDTDVNNDGILSVGETWTYKALYPLIQNDLDDGEVSNQAFVSGVVDQTDIPVSDFSHNSDINNDGFTITVVPAGSCVGEWPTITLIKIGVLSDLDNNGCPESIVYTFSVSNMSGFDMHELELSDVDLLGGTITGPLSGTDENNDGILSVGETWTYQATYGLTQNDIDSGFVTNSATVSGELFNLEIPVMDISDPTSPNEDNPTQTSVSNDACADEGNNSNFEIFNGITPNNDGINDYFQIVGIENYPNNNVKIFNRWGVLVYESDGYGQGSNLFHGISDGRATLQKERELPSGTYFFILTFTGENPGSNKYSGYLYINRD